MRHAFIDIGDKTMCSRCGNEVLRVDEVCPAITDGEIYAQGTPTTRERDKADAALATVILKPNN